MYFWQDRHFFVIRALVSFDWVFRLLDFQTFRFWISDFKIRQANLIDNLFTNNCRSNPRLKTATETAAKPATATEN